MLNYQRVKHIKSPSSYCFPMVQQQWKMARWHPRSSFLVAGEPDTTAKHFKDVCAGRGRNPHVTWDVTQTAGLTSGKQPHSYRK